MSGFVKHSTGLGWFRMKRQRAKMQAVIRDNTLDIVMDKSGCRQRATLEAPKMCCMKLGSTQDSEKGSNLVLITAESLQAQGASQ